MVLIKSINKFKNVLVYENSAGYPWTRLKDFVLEEDGKKIKSLLIVSESIIPVSYLVPFSDLEKFLETKIILKSKAVSKPYNNKIADESISLLSLKKEKIVEGGRKKKLSDICFDIEAGEIEDFVFTDFPIGKKHYFSPEDACIKELIAKLSEKI